MNEFRENFNKAMGRLSADRDIVSSAKIRAAERPERKISAKRIFGTAAAVCGILICGVTAAAATGLIDFEAVFGRIITVEDAELARSLVGTVNDFKYKVSDKNYKIDIKGVTGDVNSAVAVAELSRVDGTPVSDCFVNSTDEGQFIPLREKVKIPNMDLGYSYSIDHRINETGNIEFFIDLYSDGGIGGRKITIDGEKLYPASAYIDFEHAHPSEAAYTTYTQYGENGGNSGAPTDLNDIIALDLKWEFSFTYMASDKSQQVKSLNAPEESFPLNLNVRQLEPEDYFVCKLTAQPTYIEAGSTGGRVDFEYEATGYEPSLNPGEHINYATSIFDNNEVYIIMSDGERIRSCFDGGSEFPDGDICKCSFNLTYWDIYDDKIFVNADDITAVSINGTVYTVK